MSKVELSQVKGIRPLKMENLFGVVCFRDDKSCLSSCKDLIHIKTNPFK